MKKRFLLCMLVALVVLMSVVSVGCDNSGGDAGSAVSAESDVYETFIAAAEALNNTENATMEMNMTITMSGESQNLVMTGPVQMMREDGNLQMFFEITTEVAGQVIPTIIYYKDGFAYVDMSGVKVKQAKSEEDILTANSSGAQIFDKEYVKDMKSEENADGILITMTIDGKGLEALAQNSMTQTDAAVSEMDVEYNDATMLAQLDNDGNMVMQDITMSFTTPGEATEIHSVLDNVSFGGAAITFPDDLDAYQEVVAQ